MQGTESVTQGGFKSSCFLTQKISRSLGLALVLQLMAEQGSALVKSFI